jgi:hypothetical protein
MDISIPIVGFIFVCIIFPRIVKSKPQFYMAFAVLLLALLLDVIAMTFGGVIVTPAATVAIGSFGRFLMVLRSVLWIVDIVLLVMATGGLSLHELGGELKGAYEVIRRGETEKTVVFPKSQAEAERTAAADAAASPVPASPPPPSPASRPPEADRSIPLE